MSSPDLASPDSDPADRAPALLPGLRAMTRAGIRSVLAFRFDIFVAAIGMIIQVVLTVIVWRTVYAGHHQVAGIGKSTAVAYAVLAACFQTIVMPWSFSSIPMRIRLGQIGVDLTRPQGLISQTLAQNTGTMIARLPIGLIGLATGLTVGGLRAPANVGTALLWVLSMALGVANVMLANLTMSMIAFWTVDNGGPMILYRFGSAFCSGALIPLWFMPGWLQHILGWLPFQAQMYMPLTIWFGTVTGKSVIVTLGLQILWIGVLALILKLVWSRATHRVVVQGG